MHASYDAVIPAKVRYDKELSASAKLFYGEIRALTYQEGYCFAKNSYFIEVYGINERQIQRWLKLLQEKGYIGILYYRKQRRIYTDGTEWDNATFERAKESYPDKNVALKPTKMSPSSYRYKNINKNTGKRSFSPHQKNMKKRFFAYDEDRSDFYEGTVLTPDGEKVVKKQKVIEKPKPWNPKSYYREVLTGDASLEDKLMVMFCIDKKWFFDNKAQFLNAVYRHKKSAKTIASLGYSLAQIKQAIKKAKTIENWTLETVLKFLPDTLHD